MEDGDDSLESMRTLPVAEEKAARKLSSRLACASALHGPKHTTPGSTPSRH